VRFALKWSRLAGQLRSRQCCAPNASHRLRIAQSLGKRQINIGPLRYGAGRKRAKGRNRDRRKRGAPVDLAAIRRVGLLTVEGENNGISRDRPDLCRPGTLPQHSAIDQGELSAKGRHFGVFNASRFRNEVVPGFHASMGLRRDP